MILFNLIIVAAFCSKGLLIVNANPLQHISEIEDIMSRDSSFETESAAEIEADSDDVETTLNLKAVTSEQVAPIVSSLLTSMGNSLGPLLGPLAPLSNVIGPMINTAFTDLVVNAINGLLGAVKRNAFGQVNGYDSFVLDIPNQGSYLLLSKRTEISEDESVQSQSGIASAAFGQQFNNNLFDSSALSTVSAIPITNTLLDNLKGVASAGSVNIPHQKLGGLLIKKKLKKKKKKPSFLIPLGIVRAANGNLNTFAKSRSSSPLSDYQLDVY